MFQQHTRSFRANLPPRHHCTGHMQIIQLHICLAGASAQQRTVFHQLVANKGGIVKLSGFVVLPDSAGDGLYPVHPCSSQTLQRHGQTGADSRRSYSTVSQCLELGPEPMVEPVAAEPWVTVPYVRHGPAAGDYCRIICCTSSSASCCNARMQMTRVFNNT